MSTQLELRRTRIYLVVSLLLIAANLRPAVTSLGAVVPLIGADLHLGAADLGLIGAAPLVVFGAVSFTAHGLVRRWGAERVVFSALLVEISGTAIRVTGTLVGLCAGTVALACGIGVLNVVLSALVKRVFHDRVAAMTGAYSAVLLAAAALASGVALPVAGAAGWPLAIGVWAVPALVAALLWIPRLRGRRRPAVAPAAGPGSSGPLLRSPVAWQITLFMAFQALTNYVLITWLPTIEAASGIAVLAGGFHLVLLQLAAIPAGLLVPLLMRGDDQRLAASICSALMITALAGLAVAPVAAPLWALVAGVSSGAALVVALTLAAQRAESAQQATQLSGMAQGVGYLLAAVGPAGCGLLFDAIGSWSLVLACVALVPVAQLVIGLLAGRARAAAGVSSSDGAISGLEIRGSDS